MSELSGDGTKLDTYENCDECLEVLTEFGVIKDLISQYLFTSGYITKLILLYTVYQETMVRITSGQDADGMKYFFICFSLLNFLDLYV